MVAGMRWQDEDPKLLARLGLPDELLTEVGERNEALGLGRPSRESGRLLQVLAGGPGPRRILSIGSDAGYAAIALSRGATEGIVLVVDPVAQSAAEATRFVSAAQLEERVAILDTDPEELASGVEERFDILHLSTPTTASRRLLDRLLPHIEVGGLVIAEGVLDSSEPEGDAVPNSLAGYFVMHPQLDAMVLAVGRGMAIGRKKAPLVTELGGPY